MLDTQFDPGASAHFCLKLEPLSEAVSGSKICTTKEKYPPPPPGPRGQKGEAEEVPPYPDLPGPPGIGEWLT